MSGQEAMQCDIRISRIVLAEEQMSSDSDSFLCIYLNRLKKKMLLLQQLLTQQNDDYNSDPTNSSEPGPSGLRSIGICSGISESEETKKKTQSMLQYQIQLHLQNGKKKSIHRISAI